MMHSVTILLAVVATAAAFTIPPTPGFPMKNAAAPGMTYPAVGLGTGGYGLDPNRVYPECWIGEIPGCGDHAANATKTWLQIGGRRIDSADSYFNQEWVQKGIAESGVPRAQMFITSKIGNSNPMGYNDTLQQMASIKTALKTSYVDLLLVHWPTSAPSTLNPEESSDPLCNTKLSTYDEKACRLSTWKAMELIFKNGDAKAIGVSNYNSSHIQEIIDAGMLLPSVNQCPFNPYRSATQMDTVTFCQAHDIIFNGYSPLGIPDLTVDAPKTASLLFHKYPSPMTSNILNDPKVVAIASAHGKTSAQILLNWANAKGIPTNPRSNNLAHMIENLSIFDFSLTADETKTLDTMPQDYCDMDDWYECAPRV